MACGNFTHKLRSRLIESFGSLFDEGSNDYVFLAVSKTTPWNTEPKIEPNEDTIKAETDFWREMIVAKRITNEDISYVIPRYDWSPGVVWDEHTDTGELFTENISENKRFYVLVDNERVYKCISNNNGAASAQKPTETTPIIFQTSDGYKWKYLARITPSQKKFLTSQFIPVRYVKGTSNGGDPFQSQFDVQQAAKPMSIEHIKIIEVGDRYLNAIPDNVSNIVTSKVSDTQYRIVSSRISSVDGAYLDYTIKITDPLSANFGAIRRIVGYDGDNLEITIESEFENPNDVVGHQFSIIPSVIISGDGMGATAEVRVNPDNLYATSIEVINSGEFYTYATTEVIPAPNSGTEYVGSTGGIRTDAVPVFAEPRGHGFNPVLELGARHLAISANLNRDESGLLSGVHNYRRFGLLMNPTVYGSDTVLAGNEDIRIHSYAIETTNPFLNDFLGLTAGDRRIIGEESGYNGLFYDFSSALANPSGGVLGLYSANGFLSENESLIITSPDYTNAQLSQIRVVELKSNRLETQKLIYRQTYTLNILDATNQLSDNTFPEDVTVVGMSSGATGIVAAWYRKYTGTGGYSVNEGTLELVDVSGQFDIGENVRLETGDVILGSINSLSTPELQYHSGELLYSNNIQVLQRDPDQKEEYIIVVGV